MKKQLFSLAFIFPLFGFAATAPVLSIDTAGVPEASRIGENRIRQESDTRHAFVLTGKNNLLIPAATVDACNGNYTLLFNVRRSPGRSWQYLAARDNWNAGQGWIITTVNNSFQILVNSQTRLDVASPFLDEAYHQLAVILRDGCLSVALDGKILFSDQTQLRPASGDLYIGAGHGKDGTTVGYRASGAFLNDVRFFDRPLDESELTALWESERRELPPVAAAPNGIRLTHGPWLLNPLAGKMTVCWMTDKPCGGTVEYRKKGEEVFRQAEDLVLAVPRSNTAMHRVFLSGLEYGAEYEYRLIARSNSEEAGSRFPAAEGCYTFRAADPEAARVTAFFTSDIHCKADRLMKLIDLCGGDVDFHAVLGDINWGFGPDRPDLFKAGLDAYVARFQGSKPLLFVRGNHDMDGIDAADWGTFLPTENGKSYFAFRQGPVLFIVLDSGRNNAETATQELRSEQRTWLLDLKQTEMFRTAAFRVVLCHIPTHGIPESPHCRDMRNRLGDVLNDGTIHLMLAGHEHRYMRFDAGSKEVLVNEVNFDGKQGPHVTGENFRYTLVVNDGPGWGGVEYSAIRLEADNRTMHLNAFDDAGNRIDGFTVEADAPVLP